MSLGLIASLLFLSACVPNKSSSASSSNGSKSTNSNTFTINTVRVGSGSSTYAAIVSGNYYSKFDPVTFAGTCKGDVQKIKVEDTPLSGSTTSQVVNCSNNTFTWSKSLNTENSYSIVFTPMDSSSATISSIDPITKSYTYDVTDPDSPTFVSPTITNNYTITDGTPSITIVGQVLNEVVKIVGPNSSIIPLIPNPDGIHKNFTYIASVAVGTTANFTFVGSDAATNSSSSTITIDSVLTLSVPVAAQELGGSYSTPTGLKIQSTVGFMSEVVVDSNVKHVTGSSGIIGNL
jgi:hypothetical protein